MAWLLRSCHYVTIISVLCLIPYDVFGWSMKPYNHNKRAVAEEEAEDAQPAQQQNKPLYSFDLENSYKSEIEALDKEYSIPIAYKMEPKIAPAENEKIEKEATDEQVYVSKKPRRREHRKSKTPREKYAYESSNIESKQAKNIDPSLCEEVEKDNMKCTICQDKKNGGNSKTCSYSATQKPKEYHHQKSSKYTSPRKTVDLRYKRTPKKAIEMDPYEQFKSESQAAAEYEPKDGYFHEYKLPADYFSGDTLEKSESEDHVTKLMKDGADCKEVKKDDMTCTVCKNNENGGTYEKCSYSMTPKEKKYAFVKETRSDGPKSDDSKSKKSNSAGKEENLKKQASENVTQRASSSSSSTNDDKQSDEDKSDKDVDDVLKEFSNKDRKDCKKSEKNGMTCYLCVAKNGGKHEECMFVSGNQKKN